MTADPSKIEEPIPPPPPVETKIEFKDISEGTLTSVEIKELEKTDEGKFKVKAPAGIEAEFESICQLILDINGHQTDMIAGQPKSYIEKKHYMQVVQGKADDGGRTMPEVTQRMLERALNCQALGGGKAGLMGAHVRHAVRNLFSFHRECVVHIVKGNVISDSHKTAIREYAKLLQDHFVLAAMIEKEAKSIVAQSGVNIYTKLHHWDVRSVREWNALFSALSINEMIGEQEYRPLVYLAVHPIPLNVINAYRKAAGGKDQRFKVKGGITTEDPQVVEAKGFVNSVSIRARGTPAGSAVFAVAAVAWRSIMSESYAKDLVDYIESTHAVKYTDFRDLANDLLLSGDKYHIMAAEFGEDFRPIDMNKHKIWVDVGTAYTFGLQGGTLARSAALKKHKDNNPRIVQMWETRFRFEKKSEAESLSAFLVNHKAGNSSATSRLKVLRDEIKVARVIQEKSKVLAAAKIAEVQGSEVVALTATLENLQKRKEVFETSGDVKNEEYVALLKQLKETMVRIEVISSKYGSDVPKGIVMPAEQEVTADSYGTEDE